PPRRGRRPARLRCRKQRGRWWRGTRGVRRGAERLLLWKRVSEGLSHPSVCPLSEERRERGEGQATRAISTAWLSTLPCLHLPPIDVLVSNGPSEGLCPGSAHLGEGFPLRCLQRFSRPNVATRRCLWPDSRHTR